MDLKNEKNIKTNSAKINSNNKKVSCAQKNEHLKTLMKLKQEEYVIEKTVINHIENAKIDSKILQDIQRIDLNLTNERQKIFYYLQNSVKDVKEGWNDIKTVIGDSRNFGNLDVIGYKTKLHKLSEKIQEFNKNNLMESLKENQNSLDEKLMKLNLIINRYENCDFAGSSMLTRNQNRKNDVNLQDFEEVDNFSSLIAKTGHTQNWNNQDHLLFLKLRKKYKSIPALVNAIQTKCPDLSAKCIVNHEAWYKVYLKLQDQQKEAIKSWQQQKEFKRIIRIEKAEKSVSDVPENFTKTQNPGRTKKKCVKTISNKTEKSRIDNKQAEKKRELIKRWKEEKENKRLMDEEQAKLGEQSKQFFENHKKARAQRLKVAIAEFKKRKSLETDSISDNKKENILKSAELIKSFREQDIHYIEKRRRILSSKKENNPKVLKKPTESTEIRASTLFKLTEVWKEKCKNETKGENQELVYIKDLPEKSVGKRNMETF